VLRACGTLISALAASSLGARPAKAAGCPEHPIKIIVPFDGMKKRIDDEVPKWRDIVAKAGIKPV
jgi:hypothetical protein